MNPLLSIIIPIYNVRDYLEDCLNSVINQSIGKFEVLLIDDGSTDGSSLIAADYAEKYQDIFIYQRKDNGGLSDARNYGIELARGEYLLFLDSDDLISNDTISKLLNEIEISDCDVICFGINRTNDAGETVRYIPPVLSGELGEYLFYNEPFPLAQMMPNACNKLFKASLFKENNILFPVGLWYEDLATVPILLHYSNRVKFISDALYFYREREGSIMNSYNPKVMDVYQVLERLDNFFSNKAITPSIKLGLNKLYINLTMITLVRLSKCSDSPECPPALIKIKKILRKKFNRGFNILGNKESPLSYRVIIFLSRLGLITPCFHLVKLLVDKKFISN